MILEIQVIPVSVVSEMLYVCSCVFNYLWFCENKDYCKIGDKSGISLLHGVDGRTYSIRSINSVFRHIQNVSSSEVTMIR